MSEVTVVPPGGGELIGDSPDRRVEILADHGTLTSTWSRFGPGRDGADLHVHREHTDLFYVLVGEFTLRLGLEDEAVPVPAGTLVRVPPMVVHGFRNASDAELRFLNFHAPGMGFGDYMRALRDGKPAAYDQFDPPEEGTRPTSEVAIGEWADEPAIKLFEARSDRRGVARGRAPHRPLRARGRARGQRRAGRDGCVGARAAGRPAHARGDRPHPRGAHARVVKNR